MLYWGEMLISWLVLPLISLQLLLEFCLTCFYHGSSGVAAMTVIALLCASLGLVWRNRCDRLNFVAGELYTVSC